MTRRRGLVGPVLALGLGLLTAAAARSAPSAPAVAATPDRGARAREVVASAPDHDALVRQIEASGAPVSPEILLEGKYAPGQVRPDFQPPCAEDFAPAHYPAADPDPSYDVTHYEIHLELFPAREEFHGRVRIDLTLLRPLTEALHLNFCGPPLVGVWEGATPLAYDRADGDLAIDAGRRPAGARLSLWVEYGGYVSGTREWRGVHWPFPDLPDSPAIYTFSEAEFARWWFPGHDVPADKATVDLYVRVPRALTVAANGQLVSDRPLDGDRHEVLWRETNPIATYLVCVHAGPYALLKDSRLPGTPVWNYVYPADSTLAVRAFFDVPEMIRYFSALFGPYPFERYGQAEASFSGGMEHQQMTTLADFVVRNADSYQWLIAHELGHHWWGDSVTLRDWRHIWLNEGFATYADALWAEHQGGRPALMERMDYFAYWIRFAHDRNVITTVVDPLSTRLFSIDTYNKGAWILHMLRGIVGDATFFEILRAYQAEHRHGTADTDDFVATAERVAGRPLRWFFDPWLNGEGMAEFQYDWRNDALPDGTTLLRVTVRQKQLERGRPLYVMPLELQIQAGGGELRPTVRVERSPQTFAFVVDRPVAPDDTNAVRLDTGGWILKTVERTPLTPVDDAADLVRVRAVAAPAGSAALDLVLAGGALTPVRVEAYDVAGRRVAVPFNGALPPGVHHLTWDGRAGAAGRAASGLYFLKVTAGPATRTVRAALVR